MTTSELLALFTIASFPAHAAAKPAGDFGAVLVCAYLAAMPKGYFTIPRDYNKVLRYAPVVLP